MLWRVAGTMDPPHIRHGLPVISAGDGAGTKHDPSPGSTSDPAGTLRSLNNVGTLAFPVSCSYLYRALAHVDSLHTIPRVLRRTSVQNSGRLSVMLVLRTALTAIPMRKTIVLPNW